MDILIAPTRFLPSAGSKAVAEALERGVRRCPDVSHVLLRPIPAGGRGSIDVMVRALSGRIRRSRTVNAMGRSMDARWAMLPDGSAMVDAGEILGQSEVTDVSRASSWGLGQLLKEITRWNPTRIVISLGDVMTHDGGRGLLECFGITAVDGTGTAVPSGFRGNDRIARVVSSEFAALPVPLVALYPRALPLTGKEGMTYTDGGNKGLAPFQIEPVEQSMRQYSALLEDFWATSFHASPGSGEGGGVGFALMGLGAKAYPVADYLLEWLHIESYWRDVDWVLTAQVALDRDKNSLAAALARRLDHSGRPLIAIAERLGEGYADIYTQGVQGVYPLIDKPKSTKETERSRIYLLEQAGYRVAMWMRHMATRV